MLEIDIYARLYRPMVAEAFFENKFPCTKSTVDFSLKRGLGEDEIDKMVNLVIPTILKQFLPTMEIMVHGRKSIAELKKKLSILRSASN